ncbi:arsenate reductase family protein [uncultured Parabacteroides sp.]|uniref:arsenate reductase family protein n=1 Tax=uncultured Parabacteroides sp. TaxID=512312 RepID=UPI00262C51CC|nr:arsenate reductase family protein [uncultured Parabacteroides sp.]
MSYLFLEYPKCSTCRNAKKWLDEHKVTYEDRHIIDRNPSVEELTEWIGRSKLPLKNFFNTSGQVYKEMRLKDKLPAMSEEEQIALLASDGKLVKRPLLVGDDQVVVGFKPDEWTKQVK